MQLLNDWSNDLLLLMNITQKAAIISFIIPTFHISETCLNQIKKHLTIVPSLVLVYFSGCCLSPGLHTHTYCINASLFTAAASHWSSLFIFCFISLHILFSSVLFCTHQKWGFLDKIHINFSYCTSLVCASALLATAMSVVHANGYMAGYYHCKLLLHTTVW